MEHEAEQTKNKFRDQVQIKDVQLQKVNSKYLEIDYRLNKQIELHGDFHLIDKEN